MNRQTFHAKAGEVERQWWVVDAEGHRLGRLAAEIAVILMGKHRPDYTPHIDTGDFVVVTNAEKIRLTGNKLDQKMHVTYSGHPGGQKKRSYRWLRENRPELLIESAVRRMMPSNKLAHQQIGKLKVYAGEQHPHQAQAPRALEMSA